MRGSPPGTPRGSETIVRRMRRELANAEQAARAYPELAREQPAPVQDIARVEELTALDNGVPRLREREPLVEHPDDPIAGVLEFDRVLKAGRRAASSSG